MTTIDNVIDICEQAVIDAEKCLHDKRVALRGAIKVREAYADAVPFQVYYLESCYRSGTVRPDSVDAEALYRNHRSGLRFMENMLYKNLEVDGGAVRVYSTMRVDVIAGFEAFNANKGARSLVDCLMDTAATAQKAYDDSEREQKMREAEFAKKAADKAVQEAQPVRIVADDTKPAPTPAS